MADQNPAATPAAAPAAPATPANNAPPAATPAGTPAGTPPGNGDDPNGGGKVEISLKEYKQLQRDAARARSPKNNSDRRINDRYSQPAANADPNEDQEVAELRNQVATKDRELLTERLNNKVRDLLETEEYKDIPATVKKWVKSNPIALVDPRAKSLDDAIADIQDRLDEAIESVTTPPGNGATPGAAGQPPATTPTSPETPPVHGSQPAPGPASTAEPIEGKTGTARSTAILKNLFKQAGIRK